MTVAALALVATWLVLLAASGRPGAPGDASRDARARSLNRAMLAVAVLASVATCAAPVAGLVGAFERVAQAAPAEKAGLLGRSIEVNRATMPLALLSIPILVAGSIAFASNRRRAGRGAARPRPPP